MAHTVLNIKNARITIDGTEYSDAIDNATLNVTSTDVAWLPISGNKQTETGVPEFTLSLNFGQDLSSAASLTMVLLSRHGQRANVVLTPDNDMDATIACNVTLKAGSALGGGVGVATATAELPVNGAVTITPADGLAPVTIGG